MAPMMAIKPLESVNHNGALKWLIQWTTCSAGRNADARNMVWCGSCFGSRKAQQLKLQEQRRFESSGAPPTPRARSQPPTQPQRRDARATARQPVVGKGHSTAAPSNANLTTDSVAQSESRVVAAAAVSLRAAGGGLSGSDEGRSEVKAAAGMAEPLPVGPESGWSQPPVTDFSQPATSEYSNTAADGGGFSTAADVASQPAAANCETQDEEPDATAEQMVAAQQRVAAEMRRIDSDGDSVVNRTQPVGARGSGGDFDEKIVADGSCTLGSDQPDLAFAKVAAAQCISPHSNTLRHSTSSDEPAAAARSAADLAAAAVQRWCGDADTDTVPVTAAEVEELDVSLVECPVNNHPAMITECCRWLLHRPNSCAREGLFRVPGSGLQIKTWLRKLAADPQLTLPDDLQVTTVTSLIVQLLARFETEMGRLWVSQKGDFDLRHEMRKLAKEKREITAEFVQRAMLELPVEQVMVLRHVAHLLRWACKPEYLATSLMDSAKFAMCVLPTIMGPLKIMIDKFELVFGDDGAELDPVLVGVSESAPDEVVDHAALPKSGEESERHHRKSSSFMKALRQRGLLDRVGTGEDDESAEGIDSATPEEILALALGNNNNNSAKRVPQIEPSPAPEQASESGRSATQPINSTASSAASPQLDMTHSAGYIRSSDLLSETAPSESSSSRMAPSISNLKFGVAWEMDSQVVECRLCGTTFGIFTRKHHCRFCGKIVCSSCSRNKRRHPDPATREKQLACDVCFLNDL